MSIDPQSVWAQRAIALRAMFPAAPAKAGESKDAAPAVGVKLPGK